MTLILLACASSVDIKDSPAGQADTAADTADTADTAVDTDTGGGDTETGDPLQSLGFDFDGTWYDVLPTDTTCSQFGNIFAFTSNPSPDIVAYVYFGAPPEPGEYTVIEWTGMEATVAAGKVGFAIVGLGADMPIGNSSGAGGSAEVIEAEPAAAVVSWRDLALVDYQGGAHSSTSGMVACL